MTEDSGMSNIRVNNNRSALYLPQDLVHLRQIERDFKKFYEVSGFCTREHAISDRDFGKLVEQEYPAFQRLNLWNITQADDTFTYEKALMEDSFFQNRLDISAVENARYMPAVLHRHQFFEMAFLLSGSATNFTGNQAMELKTGDVLIMPPGSVHGICTYQDDGILINILMRATTFEQHFLNLLPDDDLLRDFFSQALYRTSDTPFLLFHTGNDTTLRKLILGILMEFGRNNRYKNTMLSSMLSMFFVNLMRDHEKDVVIPTWNPSVMNENTIFIIEYMQKNYARITLKHLAEFFHYSERQMQRIIHTATGFSFGENIRYLRMKHGKEMLRETNLSVQEIADILGYYDAGSFRHAFRASEGMTPQMYRKSARKKSAVTGV